jgi:cytochrome c-type biogenesis protein CcmH/NrfG
MMLLRVFTILIAVVIAFSIAGCGHSASNANTENTNVAENPFANITDANQALAEGNRLLDEDQVETALEAFKQAVKLNPDLAEAWFKMGIAYSLLEKAAQQSGDKVIGESDSKAKPLSQKAFEKAVEAYKKWLDANPNDDVAWFNLGRAYAKLLKDEDAEDAFRKAVKLKPNEVEYLIELGNTLIHLAKYHEALDPLKKAVELDPDNPRAQDLLDDAEAGRQRLDYVAPNNTNKANSNTNANANANVNANSNSNSVPKNTNTGKKPDANNKKLPPAVNRP